ncbi:MAG: class I SAM-dependent methyltransferase [Pseudomonadota bacterium]
MADPARAGRGNFANRKIEAFLRRWLARSGASRRLLELGCARSIWLPYFANTLGYAVTGMDYSPHGCEQTREMLSVAGVQADIVCADFFDPPEHLLHVFDAVFSYGVAEHFEDTSACIANFSRYLAPGGLIVTLIPNVNGLPGFLQKHLNREVFDKHVPLTKDELECAHRYASLKVESSGYLVSSHFGVLNLEGLPANAPGLRVKKAVLKSLCRFSMVAGLIDEHVRPLPLVGDFAAYVYCVARKPEWGQGE